MPPKSGFAPPRTHASKPSNGPGSHVAAQALDAWLGTWSPERIGIRTYRPPAEVRASTVRYALVIRTQPSSVMSNVASVCATMPPDASLRAG